MQRSVYSKCREHGISKKEAYEAMKKKLGIEQKFGYKESGTSLNFGKSNSSSSVFKAGDKTPRG